MISMSYLFEFSDDYSVSRRIENLSDKYKTLSGMGGIDFDTRKRANFQSIRAKSLAEKIRANIRGNETLKKDRDERYHRYTHLLYPQRAQNKRNQLSMG